MVSEEVHRLRARNLSALIHPLVLVDVFVHVHVDDTLLTRRDFNGIFYV